MNSKFAMPEHSYVVASVPSDLNSRIAALENSEELRDIYSNPGWTKLMELVRSTNDDYEKYHLRMWAENHFQLAPLISWFHTCTRRYGLSFDIYNFVPLSRLIIEERCLERIRHHNSLLRASEKSVRFYEAMLESIKRASCDPSVSAEVDSKLSSCWSVLSSCSYQLGLNTNEEDMSGSPEWMNEPAASNGYGSYYDLAQFALPPSSADVLTHEYCTSQYL